MDNEFDEYQFEEFLEEEFFAGNDLDEIRDLIKKRLANDAEFKTQYDIWTEESSYSNWKEYYQEVEGREEIGWENMFPEGDDDDAITDYMTSE